MDRAEGGGSPRTINIAVGKDLPDYVTCGTR